MALLPNIGPPLPVTHQALDPVLMMRLAAAVREHCAGAAVTLDAIDAVAASEKAPASHVFASIPMDPNLVLDIRDDVLIAVCVGGCQAQGAIDILDELMKIRAERVASSKSTYAIVPRTCLDICAHSPVCISRSALGQAAHTRLKPQGIAEIIAAICDG